MTNAASKQHTASAKSAPEKARQHQYNIITHESTAAALPLGERACSRVWSHYHQLMDMCLVWSNILNKQ